jgi:hypothetical protein
MYPTAKAKHSEKAAVVIEGPTLINFIILLPSLIPLILKCQNT